MVQVEVRIETTSQATSYSGIMPRQRSGIKSYVFALVNSYTDYSELYPVLDSTVPFFQDPDPILGPIIKQ